MVVLGRKKRKTKSSTSQEARHGRSSARGEGKYVEAHGAKVHHSGQEEEGRVEEGGEANESGRKLTASEKKFEEVRRKRVCSPGRGDVLVCADVSASAQMAERVAKEAKMSHKDRVDQFNKSLAERTE